jgi:hypothetical protein
LEIYEEIIDRRGGLPHGCQVFEARIPGAHLHRGQPKDLRLLDVLGAGVKK